jgi:hypothetical protein
MPLDYTCTPDISDAGHGQTPDPLTPQGGPYLNSCDAGYFPWVASFEDTAPDVCIAFCVPGPTYQGSTANVDGLVGQANTCGNKGAVGGNMECRYLHIFDQTPPLDQYNGSGVCFGTSGYVSDWDGDAGTPDTTMPRCVDQSMTTLEDSDGDGTPDMPQYIYWGCGPMQPGVAPSGKLSGFRVMLEEKLRARLQRQAKPVNVH